MKVVSLYLALALISRPLLAAPCDANDAPCITRKALEYKYKADALTEENKMLRNELEEERSRSDNRAWVFIAGGLTFIAFFGMTYTFIKKATE